MSSLPVIAHQARQKISDLKKSMQTPKHQTKEYKVKRLEAIATVHDYYALAERENKLSDVLALVENLLKDARSDISEMLRVNSTKHSHGTKSSGATKAPPSAPKRSALLRPATCRSPRSQTR